MIYLKEFDSHSSYEAEVNMGGVDISLPNVSYCEDVKDVHYTPYNLVRFYVGEITGTTPQTVYIDIVPLGSIYNSTEEEVQVSEENKWYTYVLPKDKGLLRFISSDSVKKIVVKANIGYYNMDSDGILLTSAVEASFKGSDTSKVNDMSSMFSNCISFSSLDLSGWDMSNVTNMSFMFDGCSSLTSLDLSGWVISNATDTGSMFNGCSKLSTIRMKGCSESTINKIKTQLNEDGLSEDIVQTV